MTRKDIERFVQSRTGVLTAAERTRRIEELVRYRPSDLEQIEDAEPTSYARGPFLPPGFQAANTTDVTTTTTNRTIARYLGNAPADLTAVTIRVNVTTAGSTITWAEVGIATSLDFTIGIGADLITEGFTAVQGTFNSIGIKDTEVAVNIARGAHVWALVGQQAGTLPIYRAGIGDGISSGFMQIADTTRPSTMASPTTFTVSASAANSIWLGAQW